MSVEIRKVRLVLAYDGTGYSGWQIQPGRPTVQGTVREALLRIQGGGEVSVRGAGRTDAGVHAEAQVADARIATREGDAGLARGLDAVLPDDVALRGLSTVPDRFHATADAVRKTYVYRVARGGDRDPFARRFTWDVRRRLDLEAMSRGLERLPGTRDWSGFTAAGCTIENRVRTLEEASLAVDDSVLAFRFRADGFLTHMVRNLVGTIVEIGTGRHEPARIDRVLETGDRTLAGRTAPARGLCLVNVSYADWETPPARTPWTTDVSGADRVERVERAPASDRGNVR